MRRSLLAISMTLMAACAGRPAPGPAAAPAQETPAMESAAKPNCAYQTAELSPGQIQVTCPNGDSFVLRQGEDGKWREEAKSRAGTRPSYPSLDAAARDRCGCK